MGLRLILQLKINIKVKYKYIKYKSTIHSTKLNTRVSCNSWKCELMHYADKLYSQSVRPAHPATMNYIKKTGFNLYQSRHRAYITYSVKSCFLKILSVYKLLLHSKLIKIHLLVGTIETKAPELIYRFLVGFLPFILISLALSRGCPELGDGEIQV